MVTLYTYCNFVMFIHFFIRCCFAPFLLGFSRQPAAAALSPEEQAALESKKKAEALKNEGNELYKKRSFDAAIAKYNEAIAVEPSNPNLLLNRSAAYRYLSFSFVLFSVFFFFFFFS